MLVVRGQVVEVFSGHSRRTGKPFRRITLSGGLYWVDDDDAQKVMRIGDFDGFLPDYVPDVLEGEVLEVPVGLQYQRGGKVNGEYVQPSLTVRLIWREMRILTEENIYAVSQG